MSQVNVGEEFRKAEVEPLLPIEKKLIGSASGWGCSSSSPSSTTCSRRRSDALQYDGACRAAEK
jgi:hypothetical protein